MEYKTNQDLRNYYCLLNTHFGRYFSSTTSHIYVDYADFSYVIFDPDYKFIGKRVVFDLIDTPGFDNEKAASDCLINRIKLYLREHIKDNDPSKNALFWRRMPVVGVVKDYEKDEIIYRGMTRMAIFNGDTKDA